MTARFFVRLGRDFKVITAKIILAVSCKISAQSGTHVTDTDLQLMFLKSVYLMAGYTSTIWDVDIGKRLFIEPIRFERRVPSIFARDRSGSSGRKSNSYVCSSLL